METTAAPVAAVNSGIIYHMSSTELSRECAIPTLTCRIVLAAVTKQLSGSG